MAANSQSIIKIKGVNYALKEGMFWHLPHPGYFSFFHNVRNSEGLLASISLANQVPGQEGMVSLQSLKGQSDSKELVWERVRKETNVALPTRNGAFFVFGDQEVARFVRDSWFPGQDRHLLATRVMDGSTVFETDANWLEGSEKEWENGARQYWAGAMSSRPVREFLVHGCVYFPDWKKPPFGLAGMPSTIV